MTENLKFEVFENKSGVFGKDPSISIMTKGGIGFSTAFVRKYISESPKFATLSYAQDEESIYVGFSFTNNEQKPGVMKMFYPGKNKQYGSIQCVSFFKKHDLDYKKYADKYRVERYEDKKLGKLFIIKIKKSNLVD